MKILVTGSSGFVGRHVCEALYRSGHKYCCYDLFDGNDIRNRYQLELLFENEHFDQVIHLAALAGVRRGERFPEEYIATNVIGTKNIVDACEQFGVKRLINFSSSSVYGDHANHGPKVEAWPTEPKSIYGMTKLMAEIIVARSKIETFNIRPFTLYGPHGRKDQVLVRWIEMAKKNEMVPVYAANQKDADRVRRGYTHVADLVRGVMAMIELPFEETPRHETMNLGGDVSISLFDLIGFFMPSVKHFRFKYIGRQPGEVANSIADTTQALRLLGWKPEKDFAKEVKKLIKEGMRS